MKNRIIKFLYKIYKDEAGGDGGGNFLTGEGSMWGTLFGEGEYETYDPYEKQRKQYADYLSGKLGTKTPYQYNPAFTIPQPGIESQTEDVISKRLGSLPTANQYKEQVTAAKTQDIARERQSTEEQVGKEREMYNRLGLSSSTPWMSRAGEIGDESLMRQGDISSKYDMYGLDYGLQADQLANSIAKDWTSQGQLLGTTQRGSSEYSTSTSLQDLIRQIQEEQGYSNQMGNFLGYNPATTNYSASMGEQLLGLGADILPQLLMLGLI